MAEEFIELDNLQPADDVATDLISTRHYQQVKLGHGAVGTYNESTPLTPLPVNLPNGVIDSFGHLVTGTLHNAVDVQFYRDTPANLTTITTANGGTATATGGMATFAATTTASSNAKGVSTTSAKYIGGAEVYSLFTAAFTGTGSGTSYQRIGLYDTNDGFFVGYEAGTFGLTVRKGGVDTQTAIGSFSEDSLTGAAGSLFTRAGTTEAVDLTKLNVWRIRYGWVGSAPIKLEILAPDGHWVVVHKILQPNNAALPSIENSDLPVTCDVNSGNSSAALSILSNCWVAGTTQGEEKLSDVPTDESYVTLNKSIIAANNGTSFVNVGATPGGNLKMSIQEISDGLDVGNGAAGGETQRVTIASDSTGQINSIQSGTWNIGTVTTLTGITQTVTVDGSGVTQPISAASLPLPTSASTSANQSTIIGHVDGIEGLLTTIDADTSSMTTNIGTIAGAVAGTEMQVDVLTMPTTTVTGTVTADLSATDNAVLDQIEANTSGSTSHYRNIDANAEAEIKGTSGTLKWLHAINATAAKAYLHLYDATAASVTPGTTTPDFTFAIPTSGDTNGAGFVLPAAIEFTTAITLVCTTTLDGSTGDPGTNGVIINAGYV